MGQHPYQQLRCNNPNVYRSPGFPSGKLSEKMFVLKWIAGKVVFTEEVNVLVHYSFYGGGVFVTDF